MPVDAPRHIYAASTTSDSKLIGQLFAQLEKYPAVAYLTNTCDLKATHAKKSRKNENKVSSINNTGSIHSTDIKAYVNTNAGAIATSTATSTATSAAGTAGTTATYTTGAAGTTATPGRAQRKTMLPYTNDLANLFIKKTRADPLMAQMQMNIVESPLLYFENC